MIRTSLYLPENLHQHLLILSKRQGQSFSKLARTLFLSALEQSDYHDVLETYQALDELEGLGDSDVTDTSNTVDEILYGEHGAWQGNPGKNGRWTLALPERKS